MKNLFFTFTLLLFANLSVNAQSDCKGCKDYSILPRMPNYYLKDYSAKEFDVEKFYFENQYHLIEGKQIEFDYFHNNAADADFKFPSRLQILRNYSHAIEEAGGKILFERPNAEHGYYTFTTADEKEIWIKISPRRSGNFYELKIIEREQMRQDIVLGANLIKQKIDIYGKVTIDGIFFDVGKAIILKTSEPAILEIAKFLKSNPAINCWVVGHTDADGSFAVNSKLSLDRAKAIKQVLEAKHNISENRLFAEGVGPLAPVASNKTEKGKQQNRRVELVLK